MKLLLVGGGHAHQVLIDRVDTSIWKKHEVTLISNGTHSYYSGMLPGYLTQSFTLDQISIDLKSLCARKGIHFIDSKVIGIETNKNKIALEKNTMMDYDALSLNLGSTSQTKGIEINSNKCHSIKPINSFHNSLVSAFKNIDAKSHWVFIGGGAASIEVCLGVQTLFDKHDKKCRLSLISGSEQLLETHNPSVQKHFLEKLREREINVFLSTKVSQIKNNSVLSNTKEIIADADFIALLTGASAPDWLSNTDLPLNDGFIQTDNFLKVIGTENVFASGDCAQVSTHSIPKAGVFAVREGEYLSRTLMNQLFGKSVKPYQPQKRFLSLIVDGHNSAVFSYGPFFGKGHWAWRLKKEIDQKFMNRFKDA